MSRKGIIVIDTPEQCDVCIAYYEGLGHDICGITEKKVDWNDKPDWYPIKPMPKRIEHQSRQGLLQEQVALGWNLCIDEILEETK